MEEPKAMGHLYNPLSYFKVYWRALGYFLPGK